jgi:aspartokinase-like uncharacterized kinase
LQVLKLGGSLLASPDLRQQLGGWWRHLQERPGGTSPWLVVVGGGEIVDVVRRWDQSFALTPRASHRLALSGMQVTARLVSALMEWPLLELPEPTEACGANEWAGLLAHLTPRVQEPGVRDTHACPLIVDLSRAAMGDRSLPESWDLTSDSLAMWLATRLGAERLVLLKAVNPLENPVKIGKICGLGWIDAYFSRMWSEGPGIQVEVAHFFQCPQVSLVQVG